MFSLRPCLLFSGFVLALFLPVSASATWHLSGFSYRKAITIDNANVDSDLSGFPLLVKFTADTDLGAHATSSGADLRFTTGTGMLLPYEREEFHIRAGSGSGVFWVKVPTITTAADSTIYAYYGKSDASDGQNKTAVWDSSYKGVWHLNDPTNPTDSTSNGNNGTNNGVTAVTGKVGGAGRFNGNSNYVEIPNNLPDLGTAGWTVGSWFNTSSATEQLIISAYGSSPNPQVELFVLNTGAIYAEITGPSPPRLILQGSANLRGTFHYVSLVRDTVAGKMVIYLDGVVVANPTDTTTGNFDMAHNWRIGARSTTALDYFNGSIDETRISSTARSTAWIKFEYNNMASATNELTWATQEDGTPPTVTSVTSPTADGTYGSGSTVAVTVTFSKAVTVTGTPQLTLETGDSDAVLNYTSGDGTDTLTFTYTVRSGDSSSDLDYASTSALALNGGTIKSSLGIDATLTLASPGAAGSLGANKALVIDGVAPAAPGIPDLAAGSDTGSGSTDNLTNDATPTFTVSCESAATVRLLSGSTILGTGTCTASSASITSSTLTEGTYAITARQTDAAGNVSATDSALTITLDTTAPVIETLSPADDATDVAVDLNLVLTFSETIAKTGTGILTLHRSSDDTIVETITVTSSLVTGSGTDTVTINPSVTLVNATPYYVHIDIRAFPDSAGNVFAGLSDSVTWNFTTVAALSSSSSSSAQAQVGGAGGHRGSPAQMATRIAQARVTILARFEGKKQESERLVAEETERDEAEREELAAREREERIARRIAKHEAAIALAQKEQEELQKKFALHRDERYAKALAIKEQLLAESKAALKMEQDALQAEQDANRARRKERLAERSQLTKEQELALQQAEQREEQAAREREARIVQRIKEHEAEIAQSQKEQEELRLQFAEHQEERFARALEEKKKQAAEAEAALLAEQEALQAEQETNAERRENRLAEREARKAAAPSSSSPNLKTLAFRRDRLYAEVGETPVLYADVPLSAWYAPYVSYVIEEKIATGYADEAGKPTGEFGVGNAITYAEVLKMAMQASDKAFDLRGLPPPRNESAQGTWAATYVAKAEALALSVFAPSLDVNKSATRGAVIQTILEVLGVTIGNTPASYDDVPKDHPHTNAIAAATFFGLVQGDLDAEGKPLNRFRPDDPINRAEVAKIIALAKELLK